jgi:hypothetical protein
MWLNEINLNEIIATNLKEVATTYLNEEAIVVEA